MSVRYKKDGTLDMRYMRTIRFISTYENVQNRNDDDKDRQFQFYQWYEQETRELKRREQVSRELERIEQERREQLRLEQERREQLRIEQERRERLRIEQERREKEKKKKIKEEEKEQEKKEKSQKNQERKDRFRNKISRINQQRKENEKDLKLKKDQKIIEKSKKAQERKDEINSKRSNKRKQSKNDRIEEISSSQDQSTPQIITASSASFLVQGQIGSGNAILFFEEMFEQLNINDLNHQVICLFKTSEQVLQKYNDYFSNLEENYGVKVALLIKNPPFKNDVTKSQIILSTPLQLDLAVDSGLDLSQIKIFAVDEADVVFSNKILLNFFRLLFQKFTENKTQFLIFSETVSQVRNLIGNFINSEYLDFMYKNL